jgi:hypothetical protein
LKILAASQRGEVVITQEGFSPGLLCFFALDDERGLGLPKGRNCGLRMLIGFIQAHNEGQAAIAQNEGDNLAMNSC